MQSERLRILRGSLVAAHATRSRATHSVIAAAGITPDAWEDLQAEAYWDGKSARRAGLTIRQALTVGFDLAGVAQQPVLAEYLAAVISVLVNPVNWQIACSVATAGLDGTKLMRPDGQEIAAHEVIAPERLFALVLAAADLKPYTYTQQEELPEDEKA